MTNKDVSKRLRNLKLSKVSINLNEIRFYVSPAGPLMQSHCLYTYTSCTGACVSAMYLHLSVELNLVAINCTCRNPQFQSILSLYSFVCIYENNITKHTHVVYVWCRETMRNTLDKMYWNNSTSLKLSFQIKVLGKQISFGNQRLKKCSKIQFLKEQFSAPSLVVFNNIETTESWSTGIFYTINTGRQDYVDKLAFNG